MKRYHLTTSQNFYGQKDAKTYYNVKAAKVMDGCRYLASNFNTAAVFVYAADNTIGRNSFIGSYSAKWDNFRPYGGKPLQTFSFE